MDHSGRSDLVLRSDSQWRKRNGLCGALACNNQRPALDLSEPSERQLRNLEQPDPATRQR